MVNAVVKLLSFKNKVYVMLASKRTVVIGVLLALPTVNFDTYTVGAEVPVCVPSTMYPSIVHLLFIEHTTLTVIPPMLIDRNSPKRG